MPASKDQLMPWSPPAVAQWTAILVCVAATLIPTARGIAGEQSGQTSSAQLASGATGILLEPQEIVVSADNPARFVVTLRRADATQRDITAEPGLQLQVEDDSIARVDHDGMVRLVGPVGETRLIADFAGMRAAATIRVSEVTSRVPAFAHEVSAVLSKSGCNLGTCHGNLHGKGGFRLSLRGDDPQFDFISITRDAGGRRIDWFAPEQSLLVQKSSGRLAHRGGVRLAADSEGYEVMRRWLAGGAAWEASAPTLIRSGDGAALDAADPARVVKLDVYPSEAWLEPEDRGHRLIVVAEMQDGSRRDVSRWARYESSMPSGITVSESGHVRSDRPADVSIAISYLDARSHARLVFLEDGSHASAPTDDAALASSTDSSAGANPSQRIDALIEQRLERLRLQPEGVVAPELFLRRLFLVVAGRLPSGDEVRQFLRDTEPGRKQRWIQRALFDEGYAYLWALRWSDLLRNEPKVMSLDGARLWNQWLAARVADDMPVDQLARELVQTVGSTFESPAASFHRTHREPDIAAEALGQVFLGVRIQCARCHNHPFDVWKQDDYYGLAAYFTTIQRKQIDNKPRDGLDKHVITGDEIISLARRGARIHHPGRAGDVTPKPLDQPNWAPISRGEGSDGTQDVDASAADQPLEHLARWLTEENRAFARNMANRIWYHLMGRGVVDPPDDFRISNPPSNPELLEYLTDRLIASGYSARTLAHEIINSDAFARQSVSQQASSDALDAAAVFAGYPLRRMSAEVLLDAVSDVTGVMTPMESEGKVGELGRAVRHPGMPRDGFLRAFGKPDRLLSCECERSSDASLSQSLLLINGEEVRRKIAASPNVLDAVRADTREPQEVINALYQITLTRQPTTQELQELASYLSSADDRRSAAEDVLWALINSQEFSWIR